MATRAEVIPADGLALAFELAAAGKTDREIAQALNRACHRTSGNRGVNLFSKDRVRVILPNRFYLGELPDGDEWVPGQHEAMIDRDLFERAEAARERNTRSPRRAAGSRSPWRLSGAGTCARCCGSLRSFGQPANGRRRVRCAGRKQGLGCDAPTFFAETVEDQMGAVLGNFALPPADRARLFDV